MNCRKKKIWAVLAVFWMIVIFCFSHQKADDSGALSGSITYRIVEAVDVLFDLELSEKERLVYAKEIEHPIRKAAHMTEYGIFACILLGNFMQYPFFYKRRYLFAEAGAVLYASTDEFHQRFVEGLSGELRDVCIDSTGALIGLLLAWVFLSLYKRKIERNS